MVYYNTNPLAAYSNLQYPGSSLYNKGYSGINKRKKRVNIVRGRGILSSIAKTIGKRSVSAVKSGAKQIARKGKQAAISQIGNLKQKAITSGQSLLNKGKTAATSQIGNLKDKAKKITTSKLNDLKNTVANKVKQKITGTKQSPESLLAKASTALKSTSSSSSSSSHKKPIASITLPTTRKSARRHKIQRRRNRRRAARMGLARTVGFQLPVGML